LTSTSIRPAAASSRAGASGSARSSTITRAVGPSSAASGHAVILTARQIGADAGGRAGDQGDFAAVSRQARLL
jgi:hypothetical protein